MGRNVKKPVRRRGAKRQAERRGGRKKKRVAFDVVTTTILIVAICVFAFSLFQLVKMLIPYYSGGKEYDKLKDKGGSYVYNPRSGKRERISRLFQMNSKQEIPMESDRKSVV